ncbi:MAG: pyrE [Gammaproteobacteria bacterium]|jgi:orotate phosphoribosyltransferase|nr:pyrE [Gammaproteobacteria bacterium]
MQDYQRRFLQLALKQGALSFGQFTLKSGRTAPYFFNIGTFCSGKVLAHLGEFYAAVIHSQKIKCDLLFGPAYKGICLAASTAIAAYTHYGLDILYAFNRKETKDHGEGGNLIGAPLKGDVIIIDDVITAGTAIRESMQYIQASQARCEAVIVALDRQECGNDKKQSAIQQLEKNYKTRVFSIVTLEDIIEYIAEDPKLKFYLTAVEDYRKQYGITSS